VVENKVKEIAGKISKSEDDGEKRAKRGEPGLCEQFTDTDSTVFTTCQY
jgi:hypothetical protein